MKKKFAQELIKILEKKLNTKDIEIEIRIGRKDKKFNPDFTKKELKRLFLALDADPDFWDEISSIEYSEKRAKAFRFRYDLQGNIIESIKKGKKTKKDIKSGSLVIRLATAVEQKIEPRIKKINKAVNLKKRWLYKRDFFILTITKHSGLYKIEIEVDEQKAKKLSIKYMTDALMEYTNFITSHING